MLTTSMRRFLSVWLGPQPSGETLSRGAKELTKEEGTSLAMRTVEFAAVDTVERHTLAFPTPKCGAFCLCEEFYVDPTAKRANGEFWILSCWMDQQELVKLQQMERPEILIGSPPRKDFNSLFNSLFSGNRPQKKTKKPPTWMQQ